MVGRLLDRMIAAQTRWAKPLGDWLHGIVTAAIFGRMLPVRDFLAGTWLGHPLHALLTDVPIGALTLTIVLDVIGQPIAADVALLIGVLIDARVGARRLRRLLDDGRSGPRPGDGPQHADGRLPRHLHRLAGDPGDGAGQPGPADRSCRSWPT